MPLVILFSWCRNGAANIAKEIARQKSADAEGLFQKSQYTRQGNLYAESGLSFLKSICF